MGEQEKELVTRKSAVRKLEFSSADVLSQVNLIRDVMSKAMENGKHYGIIEGCGNKPTLLKPGAEKLSLVFRLAPQYKIERIEIEGGHREFIVTCTLIHIPTGQQWSEGVGSCSSTESKYKYRTGPKEFSTMPVPAEYWNCRQSNPAKALALIGGPGHSVGKNDAGAWVICKQGEKVENPNPSDQFNTILKMAKKRAYVDAMLSATAASDIFTQDIEEIVENEAVQNIPIHKNGATKRPDVSETREVPDFGPAAETNPDEEYKNELLIVLDRIYKKGKRKTDIGEAMESAGLVRDPFVVNAKDRKKALDILRAL